MSSGPVKKYLIENEHHDVRGIILKHKEILGVPTSTLFEQINLRKKAREKIPVYYETDGIIYPPQQNWEQSSSQHTAIFKSEIVSSILNAQAVICDLTGGYGVDAYFFSKRTEKVHYVEPENSLLELARHNHRILKADNIEYHCQTAEQFLTATAERFDLLYIDPSRRTGDKKKVLAFEYSQPDVIKITELIFSKTAWLLVKASPLLDIQAGVSQLPYVKKVFVVSVRNECKEVLFLSEKGFAGIPEIEALNLGDAEARRFVFNFPDERALTIASSDPLTYLYEPNASILKAGAFKSVACQLGVKKIDVNTHLYTSDELITDFPGKKFRVDQFVKADRTSMKKAFPEGKANVTTRNYPLSADALKKKTGLNDGGEKYLIAFSAAKKKFLAVAERL